MMITKIEKYGARWCGPCKALDRTLGQITDVEIVHYDADDDSQRFKELGVQQVPLLLFKDENGYIVERRTGAISLSEIKSILKANDENERDS